MLKLLVSKKAQKFLDHLPPKQFRQIIRKVFALLEDPRPHDSEELRGFPFLRNDVGEYRNDAPRTNCKNDRQPDGEIKKEVPEIKHTYVLRLMVLELLRELKELLPEDDVDQTNHTEHSGHDHDLRAGYGEETAEQYF